MEVREAVLIGVKHELKQLFAPQRKEIRGNFDTFTALVCACCGAGGRGGVRCCCQPIMARLG